ncbi:MAG: AtpZ/AtpI family protein [Pseudomonadota bacterium]
MKKNPLSDLLMVSAGNVFASMVIAGLLLGYLVDGWLDVRPMFMLGFGVLGLIGGFMRVHKLLGAKDRL